MVKPIARGLGLSNLLCNELLDIATSENAYNLYAEPVLYHPISQKLLNNVEFVPCGLYANLLDMNCIEGFEDDEGKCSVAFCFHKVGQKTSHALYLPEECAEFVRDIYDAAEMPFEQGMETDFAHEVSSIMQSIDTVHRSLAIKIGAIGPDVYDRLDAWQLQNDKADLDVAILYLNNRDPQAPECYRFFRERGFVFTGYLPGSANGDYLLLQHLNGRPFNREGAVLLPNYADMIERLY